MKKQTTTVKTLSGVHPYPNKTQSEIRTFLTTKGMNEVITDDKLKTHNDFKFV